VGNWPPLLVLFLLATLEELSKANNKGPIEVRGPCAKSSLLQSIACSSAWRFTFFFLFLLPHLLFLPGCDRCFGPWVECLLNQAASNEIKSDRLLALPGFDQPSAVGVHGCVLRLKLLPRGTAAEDAEIDKKNFL
jgi:hypothetical protein